MRRFLRRLIPNRGPGTRELLSGGAIVVDVRTPMEFSGGHCEGSVNIPLDSIRSEAPALRERGVAVVTCCASGMRSGKAAAILTDLGIEAHNGGSWKSVAKEV